MLQGEAEGESNGKKSSCFIIDDMLIRQGLIYFGVGVILMATF